MKTWLVCLIFGVLSLFACKEDSQPVPVKVKSSVTTQVTTTNAPPRNQQNPAVGNPSVSIQAYVYEVGKIIEDLIDELEEYEDGTDSSSLDTFAIQKKKSQTRNSMGAFSRLRTSFNRLAPPQSRKYKEFHSLMNSCLNELIYGLHDQEDYYRSLQFKNDLFAEAEAESAGRHLKKFYGTFPRVISMYEGF